MHKIFLMHQTVCINHRNSIWFYIVCKSYQVHHLVISITCNTDKLRKDHISHFLKLGTIRKSLLSKMFFENDTYSIKIAFTLRFDMINTACPVINHSKNFCVFPVKITEYFTDAVCIGHDASVKIKWSPFIKKTYFNKISSCINDTLKYTDHIIMTELPVIHISAVTQCTIKKKWCFHIFIASSFIAFISFSGKNGYISSSEGETIVPSGRRLEESLGEKNCSGSRIASINAGPSVLSASFIFSSASFTESILT